MKAIAEQLGVKSILEGGVQRAGDRVRINVQLIDTGSDAHLWAETYDRELTAENIFAIQSEVASAISGALKATLSPDEKARVDAVPTQSLEAWEAYQLGKQRLARRTSGGLIEAETFFRKIRFTLSNGYGMTECGPWISFSLSSDNPPLGSVGRVIPYLECKIDVVDPAHAVGEVLVRGENVMKGYYKDPEATAATIDADGWLHTGDLGHLDANGFLFLTGRSKNMILTSTGQNIYPEEIEPRLNNLPYVMESLVLDHDGRIEAIVYPDVEKVDLHGIDEKALAAIMEQNRATLNGMIPKYAAVAH